LKLQSKDHRDILDVIDSLRSQGISQYIDLPQIIVCGDQSSGKSSVLEAISGLKFPTKDALCTRFAIEVVLRRSMSSNDKGIKISIIPGNDRSELERRSLSGFSWDLCDMDVANVVEAARRHMGIMDDQKTFSNDILRIEMSSQEQPHLTLVDLPGLFMAGNKIQSMEDSRVVENLVVSYMKQSRSIILCVVSAKSEFALQQVTQRAREMDPGGSRTIGLITKPDTLDEGSESQRAYVELAQNKDVQFKLGWHVLRNRDWKSRNSTVAERDAAETEFFKSGIWATLNPAHLGVDALRSRLSKILQKHIIMHLPKVIKDIQHGVASCRNCLDKLGTARNTTGEQRRYLLQLSQAFTTIIKAGVEGDYSDRDFFGCSSTGDGYEVRLRARVQNTLTEFSQAMHSRGHAMTIVETKEEEDLRERPIKKRRIEYVRDVNKIMTQNRGRELPGTFNPLIVGEMFSKQCAPWEELARYHVDKIINSITFFLHKTMRHVADDDTAERLYGTIISPQIMCFGNAVTVRLNELLEPHCKGHPITYNQTLTRNMQLAQAKRHEEKTRAALSKYFKATDGQFAHQYLSAEAFAAVVKSTEPDMENYAAMTAIDAMEAYYKVSVLTWRGIHSL